MPATIVKGSDYFQVITYTGNGGTNPITGLSFQPDFVWIKGRSGATDHAIYDSNRGATKDLASNSTAAETTQATGLVSFDSNGFTLGALSKVNTNGATYVAWCWRAGSSTVTNTDGSISSQVRANPTAGVSVVTYTGTGANATVGHGLGVAPKMVIVKYRNAAANWLVYHGSLANTQYLLLNTTAAVATGADVWNSTTPTSSVFSLGTNASGNQSTGTYVAYCFAEIAGFSKFGSYTGNGSADGPFVYTGFQPKYIMIKASSSVGDGRWFVWDSIRSTYNAVRNVLQASDSGAEGVDPVIDFTSNGFKLRSLYNGWNQSSSTYIYMAFASNPFANSNAF